MEREIWKDVRGYEGLYQVSSMGQVKSLDRIVLGKKGSPRKQKGIVMKPYCGKNGYPIAILSKDGRKKTHTVHRLMALNFLPNPENKRTVNHMDGIKTNNRLSNLEWATDKENVNHAWRIGLSKPRNTNTDGKFKGEKSPASKLTNKDVEYIRSQSRKSGGTKTDTELARELGVSGSTIDRVTTFKTWDHIGDPETVNKNTVLSKTGYKYVFANGNIFQGQFSYKKKKYRCGSHKTPEEAYKAVMIKRKEMGLE